MTTRLAMERVGVVGWQNADIGDTLQLRDIKGRQPLLASDGL